MITQPFLSSRLQGGLLLHFKVHTEDNLPVEQTQLEQNLKAYLNVRIKQRWFCVEPQAKQLSQRITGLFFNHPLVDAVLQEAQKGYSALLLEIDYACFKLLGTAIDDILRLAPCPTILILHSASYKASAPRQTLIWVEDCPASYHAAEVAFIGANTPPLFYSSAPNAHTQTFEREQNALGQKVLRHLQQAGTSFNLPTLTRLDMATPSPIPICQLARQVNVDLIVWGTALNPLSRVKYLDRALLGLLDQHPCSLIVVNS